MTRVNTLHFFFIFSVQVDADNNSKSLNFVLVHVDAQLFKEKKYRGEYNKEELSQQLPKRILLLLA